MAHAAHQLLFVLGFWAFCGLGFRDCLGPDYTFEQESCRLSLRSGKSAKPQSLILQLTPNKTLKYLTPSSPQIETLNTLTQPPNSILQQLEFLSKHDP